MEASGAVVKFTLKLSLVVPGKEFALKEEEDNQTTHKREDRNREGLFSGVSESRR